MTLGRAALFLLIVTAPTLIGAAFLTAPRWLAALAGRLPDRREPRGPQPLGRPIEQLAADLRRLVRLHGQLAGTAHLGTRAQRMWAVEAAIGARAIEAADALGVPHPVPPPDGRLSRDELGALLRALAAAGLVLPAAADTL
ncbi:hypothetical protein [Spirilliplanes yamanashiensis]|uniref:Uncharacterized protein n=1 Tax=Spirilliplanes yamanashiensis TaxID=42233 RepID=A0A8J4DKZ4_9ACTN|nr:hypothetical protein [Spirilliplanes yamanashiensis]MDP9818004.1 hypothetical protein [Spirilliplanes yamanashiensis]GIJ04813.1 hypothetical protein Sya03_41650 [Spirilliplanes yamanashiensis]